MVKKSSEKRISTGRESQEKRVNPSENFEPLKLEITEPNTAILLLKCKEKSILSAAVSALSAFAEKSPENRDVLFNLEIIDQIVPLLNHDDIFTQRFAAKLLAQMATIPCVRNYFLQDDSTFQFLKKILINNSDTLLQESTLAIFVELTRDFCEVTRFLEDNAEYNYLLKLIQSSDSSVIKNSMEILNNLTRDPFGVQSIILSTGFSLQPIYKLLQTPDQIIKKLVCDFIENLVINCKDENVQEIFRKSGGLQEMLNILENPESANLHSDILKILSQACNNSKTIDLLISVGGIQKLFKYFEELSEKVPLDVLRVIVKFADTISGKKALFSHDFVNYLLKISRDTPHPDVCGLISYGIAKMAQYGPAAVELTHENPINNLLSFLKNENLDWLDRQAAAFALKELMQCDFQNCQNFLDINGPIYLHWLIKTEKVVQETQITASQILKSIAEYPKFRETLISVELVEAMCTPFNSKIENDLVKISCCDTLSKVCIEERGRRIFASANGVTRLYPLILETQSIPVRDFAVQFVQQLSSDPFLVNLFVQAEYLLYMLKHRTAAKVIPTWDSCIESLMNGHLSIKFAYTGRLSMHDITQDGFYVLRRNTCSFPILEDFFSLKACPLESVYVINFSQPVQVESNSYEKHAVKEKSVEDSGEQSQILNSPKTYRSSGTMTPLDDLKSEASEQLRRGSTCQGIKLSTVTLSAWLELKFGRIQTDPFLYEYLELLKCKLQAAESCKSVNQTGLVDISLIASRAKLLAKFVDRQLSGPAPTNGCVDHQLDLHLREIKCNIQTTVIPLGQLRLGSYLERALLFKVLADRICLPTALIRGEYGKTWVEISVPKILSEEEEDKELTAIYETKENPKISKNSSHADFLKKTSFSKVNQRNSIFPTKLLRANFIVDLMNVPGDLIPIGSKKAMEYCEKQWKITESCCK